MTTFKLQLLVEVFRVIHVRLRPYIPLSLSLTRHTGFFLLSLSFLSDFFLSSIPLFKLFLHLQLNLPHFFLQLSERLIEPAESEGLAQQDNIAMVFNNHTFGLILPGFFLFQPRFHQLFVLSLGLAEQRGSRNRRFLVQVP